MENWEFLLQKQGDKSWLPLESPTVEILEGQYRLASRTKFADALVGIQLRYIPCSDSIHKPSQQKIAKRVNPEGLLIVMPYTNFTPGTWQIECSEQDELKGQTPQHKPWSVSVQLEVQPISAELSNDWQLNLPAPNLDPQVDLPEPGQEIDSFSSEPADIVETDTVEIEAIAEQTELALIEFTSPEPDLDSTVETQSFASLNELSFESTAPTESQLKEAISLPPALPYNLIALDRSQYLVSEGQTPALSGTSYLPGELEVVLKSPQDLETIMQARFTLAASGRLGEPIDFSFELHIPVETSQVMIGEVRLHPSVDVTAIDTQPHIYYHAIAFTYQSQDILAEVAQEIAINSTPQSAEPRQPDKSDVGLNPTNQPQRLQNSSNLELPQLPLKPDLHQPASQSEPRLAKPTKLPELPRITPLSQAQSQPEQGGIAPENLENLLDPRSESVDVEEESLSDLDFMEGNTPATDLGFDVERKLVQEVDRPFQAEQADRRNASLPEQAVNSNVTPQFPLVSDRFLDKLQAISRESINESLIEQQVNEFIDAEVEKLESEIDKSLGLEDLDREFEQMLMADEQFVGLEAEAKLDTELEAGTEAETELTAIRHDHDATDITDATDVIQAEMAESLLNEDDPAPQQSLYEAAYEPESSISDALHEVLAASQIIDRSSANASSVWPTLGNDLPIPLPILEIPEGEAISGIPFPILIKLPAIEAKLFVKFWVKDCQTRNIIDGPRWLVDFQREPDTDLMTVRTPITLPLGSMEVAFEAIAVEIPTQRESRKTSTIRTVTLPNLVRDNDVDFDPP
jgi:hypothetical protein